MQSIGTLAILIGAALMLGGCANDFYKHPYDPRAQWSGRIPNTFVAESAVVVDAPFRDDFAFLGVVQVDRKASTFEFVGLSQTGVQYFHVSGDKEGNHVRDAVGPLKKQERILLSFAEDIRQAFLETSPTASTVKTSGIQGGVRITEKSGNGKEIFDLKETPPTLTQKRIKGLIRTKWRADFAEYAVTGGKAYPKSIRIKNGTYFYRLTINTRSLELTEPEGESN